MSTEHWLQFIAFMVLSMFIDATVRDVNRPWRILTGLYTSRKASLESAGRG